jgi:hypothetical protein
MPLHNPRFIAGGTIDPCRFVKISTVAGENFTVLQAAAATDSLFGISQEGSLDPPGVTGSADDAARANKTLRVHSDGQEALLELGDTVTQGDYLTSDNVGRGITLTMTGTTLKYYGAVALESGLVNEKIRVYVRPGPVLPAIA